MKRHFIRWIILLAIGFSIGSAIGYVQSQNDLKKGKIELSPDDKKTTTTKSEKEFTLIDHNDNIVTQDNYSDSYKLIFFGFSFCPEVCPTELQKITAIMNNLGEKSVNITPIFISIDPKRDTPAVIKEYIGHFHPKMVGLTGSIEQITAVKKQYNVYARKVENEMMDEYMMDHSSFLYFMGHNDDLIALYPAKDSLDSIVQDISKRLSH